MDKTIIAKVLEDTINKNIMLKCGPKWLSKPTKADKEFIAKFFNDDGDDNSESINTYEEGSKSLFEDHITLQEEYEDDVGFSQAGKDAVSDWGDEGYEDINGSIYNTEEFREKKEDGLLDKFDLEDIDEQIELIKETIEDGPDIPSNTILFRGGHFDERIKVGDVVTQEGFASLTYDESVADDFDTTLQRKKISFYVPSGSKGVWLSYPFDNLDEQEYLIPPNTRYYVFEVDSFEAKVVILP